HADNRESGGDVFFDGLDGKRDFPIQLRRESFERLHQRSARAIVSDYQECFEIADARDGFVDLWVIVLEEQQRASGGDNADDFAVVGGSGADSNAAADRVAGEVAAREGLVDDGGFGGGQQVGGFERAALQDADAHGAEEIGADFGTGDLDQFGGSIGLDS